MNSEMIKRFFDKIRITVVKLKAGEQPLLFWIGIILLVETVSLATVFVPVGRTVMAIVFGVIVTIVTLRRPATGLALVALELAIGSKGALLKITEGTEVDGGLSLRIIIFICFLIAWFIGALKYWIGRRKDIKCAVKDALRDRGAWIALFLICLWGFIRGFWLKNVNLLNDANAWMFLVLSVPVLDIAIREGENLAKQVKDVLIAALIWLPIKTLLLLYVWSHGIAALSEPLYLWVRRTGVAEVTLVTGNLFRVFIQSQVYALFGFIFGLACISNKTTQLNLISKKIGYAIFIASTISVLISLSRSFWVGLFVGLMVYFILSFQINRELISANMVIWDYLKFWFLNLFKNAWQSLYRIIFSLVMSLVIILLVVAFPVPRVDVGSLATLFGSRGSTTDAAAQSRWNLVSALKDKILEAPFLGSGFGASVTYKSQDPRILSKNPEGFYTTYTFEWGWLEHWIKFGILGIPVMLWLVLSIGWRIYQLKIENWIKVSFVSSLAALAVLHVFTPYMNHPLGFGFLLLCEAWLMINQKYNKTNC